MDSNELKEKITTLDKGGINTAALEVEYHLKKSLPAACHIPFSLMGLTFALPLFEPAKTGGALFGQCIVMATGCFFLLFSWQHLELLKTWYFIPIFECMDTQI